MVTKVQLEELVQPQSIMDRAMLRAELEATRSTFRTLLDAVGGSRWHEKSPTTDWTLGEVMLHLTWSLEYLPQEVEHARRGKGMFNMPDWLGNPLSYWYVRLLARNCTPASIWQRYDKAMDNVLDTLATVPDSDWELGAKFYGHGFYSVADLFHTPAQHLAEHTAGL